MSRATTCNIFSRGYKTANVADFILRITRTYFLVATVYVTIKEILDGGKVHQNFCLYFDTIE